MACKKIPVDTRTQVLTESGFRCAVPTCRGILAIDLHHIVALSDAGGDDPANPVPSRAVPSDCSNRRIAPGSGYLEANRRSERFQHSVFVALGRTRRSEFTILQMEAICERLSAN